MYISDFGVQLAGFVIYADSTFSAPFYSNVDVDYGTGVFEIEIEPEVRAATLIVQRPQGGYITICELEAFEGKTTLNNMTGLQYCQYVGKSNT